MGGQLNIRLLGQENLEEIIQAEMKKYNSSIELGVELVSLEQFDDRVEVKIHKRNTENTELEEESSTYKWVVGADGARGIVRKSLGLTFLGETKDEKFVVGDIKVEGLIDVRLPLFFLSFTQRYSDVAYVGRHGNYCVSVLSETGDSTEECSQKKRTSIRNTETPGLFNFIVGGAHLDNIDEIAASQDTVRTFLRDQTSNRKDIKFGEVVCYSPYKYVNCPSGNLLKLKDGLQSQYSNGQQIWEGKSFYCGR